MNQDNWYQSSGWYEPMEQPTKKPEAAAAPAVNPAPAAEPVKTKKKRRWPWVIGGVLLSLALIIGLSVALREEQPDEPTLPDLRLPHSAAPKEPETGGDKDADKSADATPAPSGGSSEKSSWKKNKSAYQAYFDTIYPEETADSGSGVDIPRGDAGSNFRLKLQRGAGEELDLKQLYEACYPSVVGISGYARGRLGYSWGSGVILSEDGLIITNTHVVDGCDRAVVTLYDDREFEATLVGYDSISDIAVLKIEADGLPAAVFGDSSLLTVGQEVAAIGNPLGEQFRMTLTNGIVSAIARDINYKGRVMTLLQTNAALNEGNSGGPLFNLSGQVVGITNMKMMSSESSIEGIGFAIPTSTLLAVVNAILEEGKITGRVSIGITVGPIPESALEDYDLPEGLFIVSVEKGTDAAAKGLKRYDILMEVNGQPVTETQTLADIKDRFTVGDELLFKIWRDGKTFTVSVALMDTNDVYS